MINHFMRRSSVYIVAALIVLLTSCHKDPATLQIRFTPKWGADDFKLHTTYATLGGYMNFSSFDMYLSHITLIKNDNSEVEVDSAVLISYNDNAITINLTPAKGDYKSIKFGIGLDSAQNKISPADRPNDPVYGNSLLYWDAARLHLFLHMEGLSGNTSNLGDPFFYHEGNDSINTLRTTTVSKSFSVSDGQSTVLNLQGDISKVFTGANAVNVTTNPTTHTRDNPQTATLVANAFSQIFSIQ
ncbi:MAG: hypothetical protein JWO03_2354 [Bacteroidetes bacterium]|nr:hypothetical protein [Bacteroidota bacterium]